MEARRNIKQFIRGHARKFTSFLLSQEGLTVTEYAVAAGLIAATMAVVFYDLGITIDAMILALTAAM